MSISLECRERIRKAYAEIDLTPSKDGRIVSPYSVGIDWYTKFSPIEDRVWDAIRYLGLPLYPQYPVLQFFIDFADPHHKIGVEVDSVRWHQDAEADRTRQEKIEAQGWTIYRIPSWMVYKERPDFTDEEGKVDEVAYITECAEGMLWNIYRRVRENDANDRAAEKWKRWCDQQNAIKAKVGRL